jgi:hypothetical protein
MDVSGTVMIADFSSSQPPGENFGSQRSMATRLGMNEIWQI